jgi:cytochrome b subunit of formate dehydrogenase
MKNEELIKKWEEREQHWGRRMAIFCNIVMALGGIEMIFGFIHERDWVSKVIGVLYLGFSLWMADDIWDYYYFNKKK